jgi:branched-chain amino acid transport system permease protein
MKEATPITTAGDPKFTVSVSSRANLVIMSFAIVLVILLAALPEFAPQAWTRKLVEFFIYLALAEMWNLLLGYAGILSVGQQGFIGVGIYTFWVFSDLLHINPLVSVIFAAVGGAIVALPAAALVFKLRGGYLAIGTWIIAEVLRLIVSNIKRAGGASGLALQATSKMASGLGNAAWTARVYWWALGAVVIAIAVTYLLLRSRMGLALKSIRDNDEAAESNGVNLWRTKLYVFTIAGAGCALVGAVEALYSVQIQPASAFSISWTAYLLFITVIGGVGTIEGPIIGTIIFYALRETTAQYGTWYFIVLGLVAMAITVWAPTGIYGLILKKTKFMLFPLQRRVRYAVEVAPKRGGGGESAGR